MFGAFGPWRGAAPNQGGRTHHLLLCACRSDATRRSPAEEAQAATGHRPPPPPVSLCGVGLWGGTHGPRPSPSPSAAAPTHGAANVAALVVPTVSEGRGYSIGFLAIAFGFWEFGPSCSPGPQSQRALDSTHRPFPCAFGDRQFATRSKQPRRDQGGARRFPAAHGDGNGARRIFAGEPRFVLSVDGAGRNASKQREAGPRA